MFTGLVQGMGRVAELVARGADRRIVVDATELGAVEFAEGESIAVSGVCLTALEPGSGRFAADVSVETLSATTLGGLRAGDAVNLERSLVLGQSLGGHLVTGHVDAVAVLESVARDARSWRLRVRMPERLLRYVATKGSICVDGVSLTVNEIEGPLVGVNIVPHTWKVTTLGQCRPGTRVNIEVDIIARYLERLLIGRDEPYAGVDADLLERLGFAKGTG